MPAETIPASHRVVRHCTTTMVTEDGVAKAAAFFLKPNETGLSVNWLEHARGSTLADKWRETLRLIEALPRTLRAAHRLVALPVRGIRSLGATVGLPVRLDAIHMPEETNDAHSEIRGVPQKEEGPLALAVAQALAEIVDETKTVGSLR